MNKAFKDLFSKQADIYAASRPTYPTELFEFLASQAPSTGLVWDCATGNGQAAVSLAQHFDQVIATDASSAQLQRAKVCENVTYKEVRAEESGLENASIDLISVANGLHWFNIPDFFQEAHRVLKPNGVLAAWGYVFHDVTPEVDLISRKITLELLKDYWPENTQLVFSKYSQIEFPFEPIDFPNFVHTQEWTLQQMVNYMLSWSATQLYIDIHSTSPMDVLREELVSAWGDPELTRTVSWELYMKVGRKV